MRNIQILDCTLRDGGLGLEDAAKNCIADITFSQEDRKSIANLLAESELDIIELGSIEITSDDRKGYCIYPDIQAISAVKPSKHKKEQMFAALYRGPDTPIDDIPRWNKSLVEAVRVIIRYSELQKSLNFCAALADKGYKVFVQPMLTMRYTDEEIDLLIRESNKMGAYALYFVDSYGYMQNSDVDRLFKKLDVSLNKNIKIGFHSHNNMNLAMSNVLHFLDISKDRNIIVDSCINGMGQGAGNLQTELFVGYANNELGLNYKYNFILDCCEIIEEYLNSTLWGYSVTRLIPALHKCAYKYAIVLRNTYHLSYREMNDILKDIPYDLKQRYTKENVEQVLREKGYSI